VVRKEIHFFRFISYSVTIHIIPEMNVVLVEYDDQKKYDLVTENKFLCHVNFLVLPVNLRKLVPLA
jgi:hypothetical protein